MNGALRSGAAHAGQCTRRAVLYWLMPAHDVDPTHGVALFYHPAFLRHDTGNHPESARRLVGILAELERRGITEDSLKRPEPASLDLLGQVHDPTYIRAVDEVARSGGGYWDLDTYISEGSYEAAVLAAGAAVAAVDAAMSGTTGFAGTWAPLLLPCWRSQRSPALIVRLPIVIVSPRNALV